MRYIKKMSIFALCKQYVWRAQTPYFGCASSIVSVRNNIILVTKQRNNLTMKGLGYLGAFIGGALAGAAIGILVAPDKGSNTREKLSNTVDDFLKKHNLKLNRKDVSDLIEDLEEAAE